MSGLLNMLLGLYGKYVKPSYPTGYWTAIQPRSAVTDMVYGNGTVVAVGTYGEIQYSTDDGISWNTASTPFAGSTASAIVSFTSVCWTGSEFYACGYNKVITSTDGISWTLASTLATTYSLLGIRWTGTQLLLVGANSGNPCSFTSTTGTSWTARGSAGSGAFRNPSVNGNSVWIVTGGSTTYVVYKSYDQGVTWTSPTTGAPSSTNVLYGTTYVPELGLFFVGNSTSGVIHKSSDGNTWTSAPSGLGTNLGKIVWTGTRLIAFGNLGIATSDDSGASWQLVSTTSFTNLYGACATPTRVISSGGNSGGFSWSIDGSAWFSTLDNFGGSNGTFTSASTVWNASVKNGSGGIVVVGNSGSVAYSPDNGVNWARIKTSSTQHFYGVTWTGSQYILCGAGGACLVSTDGIIWTAKSTGYASNTFYDVAWNGSLIVLVGDVSTTSIILTSPDGTTWTRRTTTAAQTMKKIIWANNQFVAVPSGTQVITSPDGVTWTTRSMTSLTTWGLVWTGSKYVVTGAGAANANVRTSSDGITWSAVNTPDVAVYTSVSWNGSRLVALGNNRQHGMYSDDNGTTWTRVDLPSLNGFYTTIWNGTKFIAFSGSSTSQNLLESTTGLTWSIAKRSHGTNTLAGLTRHTDGNLYAINKTLNSFGYSEDDGKTWAWSLLYTGIQGSNVIRYSGQWVVAAGTSVYFSSNLADWTTKAVTGAAYAISGMATNGSLYVISTSNGAGTGTLYRTSDFNTFTSGTGFAADCVVFDGTRFYASGIAAGSGRLYYSDDGVTWILATGLTLGAKASITVANGTGGVVVGGEAGKVGYSSNYGSSFTSYTPGTQTFYAGAWTGVNYILGAGISGSNAGLASDNGSTWVYTNPLPLGPVLNTVMLYDNTLNSVLSISSSGSAIYRLQL